MLAEQDNQGVSSVVSTGEKSREISRANTDMRTLLGLIHPAKSLVPKVMIASDMRYILYGHLVGNSHCYALVDLAGRTGGYTEEPGIGVGFAEWVRGKWRIRGFYRIEPVWRPQVYKKTDDELDDYYLDAPTQPFWVEHLRGSSRPLILIAGEDAKHAAERYIFTFDAHTRDLIPLAFSQYEPDLSGKWLCLHASGGGEGQGREWEEFRFLRWWRGRLMEKASWRDAEGEVDHATVMDERGRIHSFDFDVVRDRKDQMDSYTIRRDGKVLWKVTFIWPKSFAAAVAKKGEDFNAFKEPEIGYLFEKLTGVPRKLLEHAIWGDVAEDIEGIARIRVSDNSSR
jgi:hypothetical protein